MDHRKTGTASRESIQLVRKHARDANPRAQVIATDLDIHACDGEAIRGKRVLVVEDGPTVTHGEMTFGAASLIAERYRAVVVDAAQFAVGSIAGLYRTYPHIRKILPAVGYRRGAVGPGRAGPFALNGRLQPGRDSNHG